MRNRDEETGEIIFSEAEEIMIYDARVELDALIQLKVEFNQLLERINRSFPSKSFIGDAQSAEEHFDDMIVKQLWELNERAYQNKVLPASIFYNMKG